MRRLVRLSRTALHPRPSTDVASSPRQSMQCVRSSNGLNVDAAESFSRSFSSRLWQRRMYHPHDRDAGKDRKEVTKTGPPCVPIDLVMPTMTNLR
ncbi:unnamed protein product [Peniophora sp. CBMAI 1063]|nr:unnamed protein product [Peniophora sp. CBMAI 1063]